MRKEARNLQDNGKLVQISVTPIYIWSEVSLAL